MSCNPFFSLLVTLVALMMSIAIESWAQCTARLSGQAFENGRTFYYHIADNIKGTTLETQIREAMNQAALPGFVSFQEVSSPVSTSAGGIQFKTSNQISDCAKATLVLKSGTTDTFIGATVEIRSDYPFWGGPGASMLTMQQRAPLHEITHGLGQSHNPCSPSESVMALTSWTTPANGSVDILTSADQAGIEQAYLPGGGGDTPIPDAPTGTSPIILDLKGDGYKLTDGRSGVLFDLNADGEQERLPWTAATSDDAFLVLDRDGNGIIDDGAELFGDRTPLHDGTYAAHGFEALRFFDGQMEGGNRDGFIDESDAIYERLRLWVDRNHNGLSEPSELFSLPTMNIARISLDYKESGRRDRYGNWFRFCSATYGRGESWTRPGLGNRKACDVFFYAGGK